MLRIVSANLNGLRAADRKGFLKWLSHHSQADIVCVQELKAHIEDLSPTQREPEGYHAYFHAAEKKGYSGVGIYCRREPDHVQVGLGVNWIDREGRYLRADFQDLTVISLYLPSGSSTDARQQVKFEFLEVFYPHLAELKASQRKIIICGDWNIAHQNIDLKNWRGNQKNSGFLPEERAWISRVIHELGWVDVWRTLYPDIAGYTWWSQRGKAYINDVGWRIDYHMATPNIAAFAQHAFIYKDEKFSDHAPLVVDYSI